jgi:hypothetical protein
LIAGNWKMNGLTAQLGEIEAIVASVTATLPADLSPRRREFSLDPKTFGFYG